MYKNWTVYEMKKFIYCRVHYSRHANKFHNYKKKSDRALIANIFRSRTDFIASSISVIYTSNKLVKDNHTALHYRNILLAVNVIISCVCIEIYRGLLSWPPRQAPLVQVISKCLIYTATHILFLICSEASRVRALFITCTRKQKIQICASTTALCIVYHLHRKILILYLLARFSNTYI